MHAAQKKRHWAPVDGLFLLNKPAGITSNQALQRIKRLLQARKGGHTGSLDPAATGMLPLCFGEATKVCAYLLDADKTYRVTARLGEATDTGDATGQTTDTAEVPPLTADQWRDILVGFRGESQQVPPMYSALKKDGKRLYELARQGQVVERAPRTIRIRQIELLETCGSRLVFRVECSKGTYIRSLVEDVAAVAGTLAHTAALHRETVATFEGAEMLDLNQAEELAAQGIDVLRDRLLPPDRALAGWPACALDEDGASRFSGGQPVAAADDMTAEVGALLRIYRREGSFIGVGVAMDDGRIAPRRVFRPPG